MEVDFLGEQTDDLPPDENGIFTVMATDKQQRFAMDGYELTLSSTDEEIFTVLTPTVMTGGNGKAAVKLHGVKPGKAQLKVSINYHSELYNMDLKAERLFDVRVGPRTYEYIIDVTDDLKARIEYTLSGQFSVWKNGETKEMECSSTVAFISWAPGLKRLPTTPHLDMSIGKSGIIQIVFVDATNPDIDPLEITGDMEAGTSELLSDIKTLAMGGSLKKSAEYEPPMGVAMPIQEGTFNFKITQGVGHEIQVSESRPFVVTPNIQKIISSFATMSEKADTQSVFFQATATIREVDPEE